jgi:hypothetical protein
MKFYIPILVGEKWGNPIFEPNYDSLSEEELFALGYYKYEPCIAEATDYNLIVSYIYELRGNTVYQIMVKTLKTGNELNLAIRDKWMQIRQERLDLLNACDYTQIADAPISNEKRIAWATYRQALRDITLQTDPFAITWPVDPNGLNASIGVVRV